MFLSHFHVFSHFVFWTLGSITYKTKKMVISEIVQTKQISQFFHLINWFICEILTDMWESAGRSPFAAVTDAPASGRKRLINDIMEVDWVFTSWSVCVCNAVTSLCIPLRAELMLRSKYRTRGGGGGLQLTEERKQSSSRKLHQQVFI